MNWPLVPFREFLKPNKRPYLLAGDEDASLVGMRLYGGGPFLRERKPALQIRKKTHFSIRVGDVIYNKLFAWKGAFGIVPQELDGLLVSDKFPTYEADSSKVLLGYLGLYFQYAPLWDQAKDMSKGAAALSKLTLNPPDFLKLTIPLPPVEEQRRIVARVDAIASRVAEARRLREVVSEEQSSFVTSLHCQLAGDRVVAVGDFLELHEVKRVVVSTEKYPQVGVKGFGEGLFSKESLSGSDTTYKAFNTLYPGALVLSQVKGWEGAIAVCPPILGGWYVSPEYRTFRCREGAADSEYLAELVKAPWFWERLAEPTRGVGARRERVRPELFLPLKMPMPIIEYQRRAVGMFRRLDAVRAEQAVTSAELDALLPSVLNRAFTGEL